MVVIGFDPIAGIIWCERDGKEPSSHPCKRLVMTLYGTNYVFFIDTQGANGRPELGFEVADGDTGEEAASLLQVGPLTWEVRGLE